MRGALGAGERERDGIDVTLLALNLTKSFALFLAKDLRTLVSPLLKGEVRRKMNVTLIPKTIGNRKRDCA